MWRLLIPLLLVSVLLLVWRQSQDHARTGREGIGEGALPIRERRGSDDAAPVAPVSVERAVVATLRGRVFDPNGRPVAKASVFILRPAPLRLATTDAEGNYELPLHERRSHLVEANLHIDLGPARKRITVPDEGDPAPLDFHLEPTGTVYGELTADGEPVDEAYVDIYQDGEWILDTETENGFFNFTDDPPFGVPLELRVKSTAGYPAQSVEFTWKGQPIHLGRIELRRFPAVRVTVRLPDGTKPEEFEIGLAELFAPENLATQDPEELRRPLLMEGDLVKVPPPAGRVAVVISTQTRFYDQVYVVRREIETSDARVPEVEIAIAKGPIVHECTLLDVEGRPLRARFRDEEDRESETDVDGKLVVELPYGGLHFLPLVALRDEHTGQWPLLCGDRPSVVIDADRPGERVRVDFGRRVLFRTRGACHVQFRREFEGRHKYYPPGQSAWYVRLGEIPPDELGEAGWMEVLSPRLSDGLWHWSRGVWAKDDRGRWRWQHDYENYRDWPRVGFARRGFTIVDAR